MIMNVYVLILLRFIHIVSGALWVGAAISYLFFVKASAKAIGPAGPQFMQNLTQRRKYPLYMISTSLLTVLAGGILFVYSSGGFSMAWLKSGPGIGFTIGSLAGLIAFLVGSFGIGPTSAQMGALGAQIAAAGGPPNPALLSHMRALEIRLTRAEGIDFVMLVLSILTMATARYWIF
jgi:hypothetical protein